MCIRDRGYTVEGFKEKDNEVEVLLKDTPSLHADMVVLAIGVTPDTALAKEAGLELGIKESIIAVSYTHLDVYKRQFLARWDW